MSAHARRKKEAWYLVLFGWLSLAAIGHGILWLEEIAYDWVFYPYMLTFGGPAVLEWALSLLAPSYPGLALGLTNQGAWGYWTGFIILMIGSILINYLFIKAYDLFKLDLLGFEMPKSEIEQEVRSRPILRAVASWSGWAAFLFLTIVWTDPLLATLLLRKKAYGFKMTARDWRLFWLAIVLVNLSWTAQVTGAVKVVELVVLPYIAEQSVQMAGAVLGALPF